MTAPLLELRDAGFAYGEEDRPGFRLEGASLALGPGDLLGIVGPNGAGKSTLLRLMSRLVAPAGGKAFLEGRDMAALPQREIARRVAWVPQNDAAAFPLTVEQSVGLGHHPRSRFGFGSLPEDRLGPILALLELSELRDRPVSRLSGGEQRRALLARALAQDPRVLLLDEPTAHLDPRRQRELVRLIERLRREQGLAAAVVLHDVNLARAWCPRVLVLDRGRVAAQGAAAETLTPALLGRVYGVPAAPAGPGQVDFFSSLIEKEKP